MDRACRWVCLCCPPSSESSLVQAFNLSLPANASLATLLADTIQLGTNGTASTAPSLSLSGTLEARRVLYDTRTDTVSQPASRRGALSPSLTPTAVRLPACLPEPFEHGSVGDCSTCGPD